MTGHNVRNWSAGLSVVVGLFAASAPGAHAQSDYPARPLRLVVPFPAGGSTDIVGRVVAQ